MESYFKFILIAGVSDIELETEEIKFFINQCNETEDYSIYIMLYDSGGIEITIHSLELDCICFGLFVDNIESDVYKDLMYLIDEKCSLEFRHEKSIYFTITKKIPLASVRSNELNQFLREYNEIGSLLTVIIETHKIILFWYSQAEEDEIADSDRFSFDIGTLEFQDIMRLSKYFDIVITP